MKPIGEDAESHIVHKLAEQAGWMDAHKKGNYVQGLHSPISSYNLMLRLKRSEDAIAEAVAGICSEIFFNYGYGRDERVAMMAHAGEWTPEFTAKVQTAIDLEEAKYASGEKTSQRDNFFTARAERIKRDGGFERWRGTSE
jgi:hypothetical protein